ncbi:hypothetical protein HYT53_01610 [Candidatus Woesearchaeota archaeon]|nr:hypothetical protein [Candidatus Woesearchaeota archaeon]
MKHSSPKCPNCGRKLTESELYCYFCEMSLPEPAEKIRKKDGNSVPK